MESKIDWETRYYELEKQIKDMMNMTLELIKETEINKSKAMIKKIIQTEIDNQLEVIVISNGIEPIFSYEIIDDVTQNVMMQKSEQHKNSCKFNVSGIKDYRVRVYIRNRNDNHFTDSKETEVLNKTIEKDV